MAGSKVETKTNNTTSGTSVAITFDTAPSAGETVQLTVITASNQNPQVPPGFNLIRQRNQNGVDLTVFAKVAKSGASATYTVTHGTAGSALIADRITGLSGDRPWDFIALADNGTDSNVTSLGTGTTGSIPDDTSFICVAVAVRLNSPGTVSWTTAGADAQIAIGGTSANVGTVATGSNSVTSTGTKTDTASWSSTTRAAAVIIAYRETDAPATDAYRDAVMADTPSEFWRLGDPVSPNHAGAWNDAVSGTLLPSAGSPTFGATSLLSAISDTAVTFDGTDDDFNDNGQTGAETAGLDGAYVGHGSVEFWVKANASRDTADTLVAFGFTFHGLVAWQWNASGEYQLHWRRSGGIGFSQAMWNPTTGDIDHVVVVTDATSMRIYRNGALSTTITTDAQTQQDHRWAIMGRNKGGTAWWTGELDEVALYRTPLTVTRILAHYNAGTGAGGSPQTISVGAAAESEAAVAVATVPGAVTITVTVANETEAAQAVAADATISIAVGAAAESETANTVAVATVVSIAVGAAAETETAQTVTPDLGGGAQSITVGIASEVEAAQTVTVQSTVTVAVGAAAEVEAAEPVTVETTVTVTVGAAAEVETAGTVTPIAGTVTITVGAASETETAQTVEPVLAGGPQTIVVAAALETETAQTVAVVSVISIAVGAAAETETAGAVGAVPGEVLVAVGTATETETARTVTASTTGQTFWSKNPVAYTKNPVAYTKVGPDDDPPWD